MPSETDDTVMNDLLHTPTTAMADGALPGDDKLMPVPNTSMLPGTEKAPTAAELDVLTRQKHDGTHALADRLCALRDQWTAGTRSQVRYSPLTSLAAAALLGAVISRLMRR